MTIISEQNLEKTKQLIKKVESKPVIIQARDEKYNRKILEYGKFDVLLSIEKNNGKASLRQINSGFNHFLGKLASKNKIAIGIDLNEIMKLGKKEKAERLGKIAHNIKVCRKTKTKLAIKTNNNSDAFRLLLSLGASTNQAKEAMYIQ